MANKGPVRFDQKNRITGTRYRLLDTAQEVTLLDGSAPENDERFVTECAEHGTVHGWSSLHQARVAMAIPNWCGRGGRRPTKCQKVLIAEGVEDAPVQEETVPENQEQAS